MYKYYRICNALFSFVALNGICWLLSFKSDMTTKSLMTCLFDTIKEFSNKIFSNG